MSVLPSLSVGGRFAGRYMVTRVIKSGGMGAVYEVLDETTASPRALKIMHPDLVGDEELRARFEQEARVTGGVESEHVVGTFDAGVDAASGTPFIVMELLRGEELGTRLKQRGAIPVPEALTYLTQAALALEKTHAAGIVHRDLKPENLFITRRDDGSGSLKILDFGVAKVLSSGTAKTTKALGTPLYMPLEQIQGDRDIGPAADRYALAHIAYAMFTGEPYWREESRDVGLVALCMRVASGLGEPGSVRARRRCQTELPSTFDPWFEKATATKPEDRFATSSEMIRALEQALEGKPVQQTETPRGDRVNTPLTLTALEGRTNASDAPGSTSKAPVSGASRRALAVVLPLALVIGGVSAYVVTQRGGDSPRPAADDGAGLVPREAGFGVDVTPGAHEPTGTVTTAATSALVVTTTEPTASASASASAAPTASARPKPVATPTQTAPARPTSTSAPKWSIY